LAYLVEIPWRVISSLAIMPDGNASSKGRRYGIHDVMILVVWTICAESTQGQILVVKFEDWKPLVYANWHAVAIISKPLEPKQLRTIIFFFKSICKS